MGKGSELGCANKRKYESKQEGKAHPSGLLARFGKHQLPKIYPCAACGYWHVGRARAFKRG